MKVVRFEAETAMTDKPLWSKMLKKNNKGKFTYVLSLALKMGY